MSARAWVLVTVCGAAGVTGLLVWDPSLGQLTLTFLRLGALAFGGGFPVISMMQRDVVEHGGWLTTREFIDGIALGQVTPGPVMITATFVGYRAGGVVGALVATIAIFGSSFVVLLGALPYFVRLRALRVIQWMIRGILAAFTALLAVVLLQFGQAALVDWKTWAFAIATAIALWRKVDLMVIIGVAAIISVLIF